LDVTAINCFLIAGHLPHPPAAFTGFAVMVVQGVVLARRLIPVAVVAVAVADLA